MQTARAGGEKTLRMAAGESTRGAAAGVDPRAFSHRRMSEIAGDPAEPGMAGKIFRLEVFRRW